MIGAKRTLASILVSLILVATAVASVWLMASAGVFTGGGTGLPAAPARSGTVIAAPGGTIGVSPGFQVAQPRDPFEPLITQPSSPPDGETTTTVPGQTTTTVPGQTTTTTVPGQTTTTVPGQTTTTTIDDSPTGTRVTLLEVRDEESGRIAVVEVDGTTYTVGVGDTFAENFKVVSLTTNGGVFTFGDSAFTLAVGQSILK
jgi:hypothetical protein